MARKESIQYTMMQQALQGMKNNNSIKAYKRDIKGFASWARDAGYKTVDDIKVAGIQMVVQKYRDEFVLKKTSSPHTEHRIINSVCKGLGISMNEIKTTKRTSGRITRGRLADKNIRGQKEMDNEKYTRLVEFQKAVGIRRAELAHLRGRDLVCDESGYLCVRVERGKGGKEQLQRILPKDIPIVEKTFDGIKPDELVFSKEEMKNHINLHGLRATHANRAYNFYASQLKTLEDRKVFARELLARFDTYHDAHGRSKFLNEVRRAVFHPEYRLRGDNRKRAIRLGLPVVYDRLAILLTSVFALSHWRCDILSNYLIQ